MYHESISGVHYMGWLFRQEAANLYYLLECIQWETIPIINTSNFYNKYIMYSTNICNSFNCILWFNIVHYSTQLFHFIIHYGLYSSWKSSKFSILVCTTFFENNYYDLQAHAYCTCIKKKEMTSHIHANFRSTLVDWKFSSLIYDD